MLDKDEIRDKVIETIHDILRIFNVAYDYRLEKEDFWSGDYWRAYLIFNIKGEIKTFCMQLNESELVRGIEKDYKKHIYNSIRHSIVDLLF